MTKLTTASKTVQVVWFKRDLRVADHVPLALAAAAGPVLPLYIHEPALVSAPDCSAQHSGFLSECLDSLRRELRERGADLVELVGDATSVLEAIWKTMPFNVLWAYQETTSNQAFQRDQDVACWCKHRGVQFREQPQNAVLRGAAFRREDLDWNQHFRRALFSDPAPAPLCVPFAGWPAIDAGARVPVGRGTDKPGRLKGGRVAAQACLNTFFEDKLLGYREAISSPLTAPTGCSRLSPYLALGVVSMKEIAVVMAERHACATLNCSAQELSRVDDALQFYVERLYWRSAYLQTFEADASLELVSQHPGTRGLREWSSTKSGLRAGRQLKPGTLLLTPVCVCYARPVG